MNVFWTLSNNVQRIKAADDIRSLSIAVRSQGQEQATELRSALEEEMGEVIKASPMIPKQRDEEGFAALKRMAQGG